jgi:hypothetical protein
MWIWIVVFAAIQFSTIILVWILAYRIRAAEAFLMILSGVVLQSYGVNELKEYLKSRGDHPAGKRLPEGGEDGIPD